MIEGNPMFKVIRVVDVGMSRSNPLRLIFSEYFTTPPVVKEYILVKIGAIPIVLGSILGFFTFAIDVTIYELSLSAFLFVVGVALSGGVILAHISLFIIGHLYRHGVVSSMKSSLFLLGVLLGVSLVGSVALFGGLVVGAIIFFWILPIDTILVPLNILGFSFVAIWWYAKGLMIIDEGKSFKQAMSVEIDLIQRHIF